MKSAKNFLLFAELWVKLLQFPKTFTERPKVLMMPINYSRKITEAEFKTLIVNLFDNILVHDWQASSAVGGGG
jgi:hypothetical protein